MEYGLPITNLQSYTDMVAAWKFEDFNPYIGTCQYLSIVLFLPELLYFNREH